MKKRNKETKVMYTEINDKWKDFRLDEDFNEKYRGLAEDDIGLLLKAIKNVNKVEQSAKKYSKSTVKMAEDCYEKLSLLYQHLIDDMAGRIK